MAFKLVALLGLVSAASGGFLQAVTFTAPVVFPFPPPDTTPLVTRAKFARSEFLNNAKPSSSSRYSFGYEIHDKNTGNLRAQYEIKTDNATYGTNTLLRPDASRLAVDYTADDKGTFQIVSTPLTLTGHISPLEYAGIAAAHAAPIAPPGVVLPFSNSTTLQDPLVKAARGTHTAFLAYIKGQSISDYKFGTDVEDTETKTITSQFESRIGERTYGSYTMVKSDGSRRTVDYTEDARTGFNAVVRNEPIPVAFISSPFLYG